MYKLRHAFHYMHIISIIYKVAVLSLYMSGISARQNRAQSAGNNLQEEGGEQPPCECGCGQCCDCGPDGVCIDGECYKRGSPEAKRAIM